MSNLPACFGRNNVHARIKEIENRADQLDHCAALLLASPFGF